jgi:hypothetical protein
VAAELLTASSATETAQPGASPSRVERALQLLSEASAALTAPIDLGGSIVQVARLDVHADTSTRELIVPSGSEVCD